MRKQLNKIAIALLLVLGLASCKKDNLLLPDEQIKPDLSSEVVGFYLLNEGNWGANKASLDYFDYATGMYKRNMYGDVNPEVVRGLGDVGNDIKIYGSRMYVVVSGSNKVEVLHAKTAKKIGQVDLPNGRYLAFKGNKAYVSTYENYVAVIDTASLQIIKKINVGQQPEEMAVVNNKLYVANSGGYNAPNYDRTVSVIDLNTDTEIKKIEVAVNLNRLKADKYGDVYVISRGDYGAVPASIYVIDTETDVVKKQLNFAAENLAIHNDLAFAYGVAYDAQWNAVSSFATINVKDEVLLQNGFITDGTEKEVMFPYAIAIHPQTGDFYLADAKDFTTPGRLYAYDKNGKRKFEFTTGDLPAQIAFYTKQK